MAVFLIGEMKSENTREREFDKEEQARREYRRSCDDEAAERQPNNSPIRYSAFMAVFFNWWNEKWEHPGKRVRQGGAGETGVSPLLRRRSGRTPAEQLPYPLILP